LYKLYLLIDYKMRKTTQLNEKNVLDNGF